MSNFIKPATLTVPKEVENFLNGVWDYCDKYDIDFYDIIEAIINKTKIGGSIEITYED
jgi:hypothetical protein